jgi:LCP family protein required for cell wall assembly
MRRARRFKKFRTQRRSDHLGRRRWPRRLAIGIGAFFVVIVVLVGGVVLYANWRSGQIHREVVNGLTKPAPGQPFDVLVVGSDSRQFVDGTGEAAQFGSASSVSGQRSDVIMVARIVPATHEVKILSIPRDTYVDIPGNVANISGPNRINAAYNNGPSLLVQTINQSFHIPINYYAEVNFEGFAGMVNALGGIGLDFPVPVKDAYSGLSITRTGCHLVLGAQALALVRSRHLYYFENGVWNYDGLSDFSRIQRQDAFFRAVAGKIGSIVTNPFALNSFLGAATKNVTVDKTLSTGEIISLAKIFRSFSSKELITETLPTIPYTTSGGADVLVPAPDPDESIIGQFLAFGTTKQATTSSALHPIAKDRSVLTSSNSVTGVPVTALPVGTSVSSDTVDYNTQLEPWNPTPCNP